MSKETITPVTYVPLIIFYTNGKPFMQYKGAYDGNDIARFVVEVAKNIQSNQKFSQPNAVKEQGRGIPAYTIGTPLYGTDDVCYLEFDDAYKK